MKTEIPFLFSAIFALFCGLLPQRSAAQVSSDHRLEAGDAIEVKVFQEPDLDNPRIVISKDGKVTLALVGEVTLAGLTATDAARAIEKAYKNGYLVKPSVTVSLAGLAKRRYTIQGCVLRPSSYFFPDGEQVTLIQAIGNAGGYTRIANPGKITIVRARQTIKVDAKKLAKGGGGETVYIQPGDVINVPEGWK